MSEAKHTPGPWIRSRFDYIGSNGEKVVVSDGPAFGSAAIWPDAAANASLIAAAPDLLEALIKYMDAIDMFDKASKDGINYHGAVGNRLATEEIARAAIAKATGKAQ